MKDFDQGILPQVIDAATEPVMVVRLDDSDWPVVLANAACRALGADDALDRPFADVIEGLVGRDLALEISESFRTRRETSFPLETGGNEYLLTLKPLSLPEEATVRYYDVFWRGGSTPAALAPAAREDLLNAKQRIRDLTREDPVTGLLNERAFRDVLEHDWAVASREKSVLALMLFSLDDFDAYVEVFGHHASASCLRRVGRAVRRCLRRASDVVGALDGARLVVLSHTSDESGVEEFASRIAASVRELGLHHPRSSKEKFITLSYVVSVVTAGGGHEDAAGFLDSVLEKASEPG